MVGGVILLVVMLIHVVVRLLYRWLVSKDLHPYLWFPRLEFNLLGERASVALRSGLEDTIRDIAVNSCTSI